MTILYENLFVLLSCLCYDKIMNTEMRRKEILNMLRNAQQPLSATSIANEFHVSRQIVVGDVALLRASGHQIDSTPRGYLLNSDVGSSAPFPYVGIVACNHSSEQVAQELYTIVDFGGCAIDVTIEHPIYGQLSGALDVRSRYDTDVFVEKVNQQSSQPLSVLTSGIHLHRIGCRDEATFLRIKKALREQGFLLE